MTDLIDQLYSAQQILIPPNLPSILKKYAKSAIRTQPRDLLLWSYHYFKAVSNGVPPPVKERIEYPLPVTASGLTPGFLKVILNQIGNVKTVPKDVIEEKWESICLDKDKVEMLFKIGNFTQEVNWLKFLAIAAGSIEQNLTDTMSLLCELLTEEPEGGSSMIPVETFLILYKYLAGLDCGPVDPFAVSSEVSEEESQIVQKDILFSDNRTDGSKESWNSLIREMGQQDSEDTLATDDLREVDSKAGLVVWPDIVSDELKLTAQEISPKPSEAFIISDTGLQVWDEEQFQNKVDEKVEISQIQKTDEQLMEYNPEKVLDETAHHQEEIEIGVAQHHEEIETEGVVQDISSEIGYEQESKHDSEQHALSETEIKTPSEESLKAETTAEEQNDINSEDDKEKLNLDFIMGPDSSMILIPTPVVSKESICSDQRSIKNITESEGEPSVGQKLIITASLKDLKVGLRKMKKEETPPKWASGDYFWMNLPGIGPIVPQPVIDEIEVFLRQCAAKQCGMVMPRNLRHFLCPSLDGLGEDIYLFNKEPECLECSIESIDDDIYKAIRLPKVATKSLSRRSSVIIVDFLRYGL